MYMYNVVYRSDWLAHSCSHIMYMYIYMYTCTFDVDVHVHLMLMYMYIHVSHPLMYSVCAICTHACACICTHVALINRNCDP